ncbi:hypothetical protein H4S02_004248, partial [Coemansia sp. RSA 2611]
MRSGRRRLSAGVVGGTASVLGSSPRSIGGGAVRHGPMRSPATTKDLSLRKPGPLERRGSSRSAVPSEADAQLGEPLAPSSSSLPASPELSYGLHRHTHPVTSAPGELFAEYSSASPCARGAAASPDSAAQDSASELSDDEDGWASAHDDELQFVMDSDEEAGACEAGVESLPTPEQLIMSQSWSTWPTPCHDL